MATIRCPIYPKWDIYQSLQYDAHLHMSKVMGVPQIIQVDIIRPRICIGTHGIFLGRPPFLETSIEIHLDSAVQTMKGP